MDPTPSFAPLAARLVAKAEEIRLAEGERDGLAQVMALFMRALLLMLACLCEALDARAAADAARAMAAPAPRKVTASLVAAPRASGPARSGEMRAPRLALVPEAQATTPDQAAAPSGITGHPAPAVPRLVGSRDPAPIRAVHAPPWRPRRETRLFSQRPGTPILLRFSNK